MPFDLKTPNHEAIASKNDEFRKLVCDLVPTPMGKIRFTTGFRSLPFEIQAHIRTMIRLLQPEHFEVGNNPYGERDFGMVMSADCGKVFWKIDYYADKECVGGVPDEDKIDAYRVMTLMLAEEY